MEGAKQILHAPADGTCLGEILVTENIKVGVIHISATRSSVQNVITLYMARDLTNLH